MKALLSFVLLLLSVVMHSVVGQDTGEDHFYLNSAQEIKTIHFTEIKDSIALIERRVPTESYMVAGLVGMAISELVPIVIEKVG